MLQGTNVKKIQNWSGRTFNGLKINMTEGCHLLPHVFPTQSEHLKN